MVFPSNFEEKLGFDTIRSMVKDHCLGDPGRRHVDSAHFHSDLADLEPVLLMTEELRQVLLFEENFPSQDYYDLTPSLSGIRPEGTYMEPEEMSKLKLSLMALLEIRAFFSTRFPGKYPSLEALAVNIGVESRMPKIIDKIIDDKSEVRDDASPALRKIRKERSSKQSAVEKRIAQTYRAASQAGWTPDDSGVTIRNGRLVIPLVATHKRKVSGLIHDESSTGHTVYLEPAEIVEMNNEIRELDFAEHREVIRILTEFAGFLRPYLDMLIHSYHILGQVDFIRAKASVAISMNGNLPIVRHDSPYLSWKEAVHPLLFLSHSQQKKPVVPLNITLDQTQRILVITGPNAGGKSVCLKTVGLLQYMYQCGLLPPARQESEFGMFRKIFIDIGDEQSLENDLSTYSSKLRNLKYFLENLDDSSLFLIDELGTGTDPSVGGTIAEASLEKINESAPYGIVTTHYSNLKLLAGRLPGIENAAMLYDTRKMKPLFKLQTGIPGSSFAFEIARNTGFPEEVLKSAEEKIGQTQLNFDRQLQDMEIDKADMEKKATEVRVADDMLHELISKYNKLHDNLKKKEEEIIRKAKEDALALLKESNKLIEKTVKEIRESQAEKEKTKQLRNEIREMRETLEEPAASSPQSAVPGSRFPVPGSQSAAGKVVITGETKPLEGIGSRRKPYQTYIDDLNQKLAQFQLTLDLRGKRADEALGLITRYIDDAVLLDINEVRILHGKGNGVLRQVTREYLGSVKEVRRFQDAPLEQGGAGITVVNFR